MQKLLILFTVIGLTLVSVEALAGKLIIPRDVPWQEWKYPKGAVRVEDDTVTLVSFSKDIDPIANAGDFEHKSKVPGRGMIPGGIRVGSNSIDAGNIIDGNVDTYWKPRATDSLEDWWVQVDLGRVVLADKLTLTFPDKEGAKPFRDFSVYVSEGAHVSATLDQFQFGKVGTTTEPNTEEVIEYNLFTIELGTAIGDNLVTADTLKFAPVQYIRFVAHKQSPDAALAEMEVRALGENIALGTLERRGSAKAGQCDNKVHRLFDGSIDDYWMASAARAAASPWRVGGQWFKWDLGAAFWLDRLVILSWRGGEIGLTQPFLMYIQRGYVLLTSDGTPMPALGGEERIEGDFDYQLLSLVNNLQGAPYQYKFDHVFPRRKVRHIFYHHESEPARYGYALFEVLLYGEGYPAEVEMESGFIDLKTAKSITGVEWEAETPPDTKVEIRTRTGDTLELEIHYYLKNGNEVTKAIWDRYPGKQGWMEEITNIGADWSQWSSVYKVPGQVFLSPTPRKFVQLKVALSTDNPEVAPVLHAISLPYHEPLIKRGVIGEIVPKETKLGWLEAFSYRIKPTFSSGDVGFDQVLIRVPSQVEDVSLEIGGEPDSVRYNLSGDSLLVELGDHIETDSLKVSFKARVFKNATLFDAFVLSSKEPEVWQQVKPIETNATKVFLPSVPVGSDLIRNVSVEPKLITPNGDDRNDFLTISFDLVKVDKLPKVRVYNLQGELIKELERQPEEGNVYIWDGGDISGDLVPPGVYSCRISVAADIGPQAISKVICVTY
ncbi:MAG: discoidin domain-containing protein [Candidatus Latescibacteria bacterium]|nr:discoidin domain-containing protein [Candidatus Latescibacterota bacterium]